MCVCVCVREILHQNKCYRRPNLVQCNQLSVLRVKLCGVETPINSKVIIMLMHERCHTMKCGFTTALVMVVKFSTNLFPPLQIDDIIGSQCKWKWIQHMTQDLSELETVMSPES